MKIMKYVICYLIEKQHRFVFDNIYICYEDTRYKPMNFYKHFRLWFYKLIFPLIPDFREYLKLWHKEKKNDYLRYNNYWR